MSFHRFVTPTYFGGLPVGYDLINVTSGGTGAGGSAFADTVKGIGNPNTGTYFVAWGEDATSSNANRGLRALSENTDALDNLFHRDLGLPVRTVDVTAGSPVAAVTLAVNTFLGSAGYTTSVADLGRLFSITDASDNEIIIQASGLKVQVTSVTLGAGDAIGGGGANGSFSGNTVQINISPSIPTGTVYRIYYGTRTNLATMPADVFTTIKIRGAEEVPAEVENLFRLLHGNNLAWNASWTTTVYDLAASGINERYNRALTTPSLSGPEAYWPTTINATGGGGWILRAGPAFTVYSAGDDVSLSDPLNALFVAKNVDTVPEDSGGVVGFASFGARRSSTANVNETISGRTPGAAAFMALWPHDFGGSISAVNFYTRVVNGSTATLLNVGAGNIDTGEAIVQLTGASNYFQTGGNSAVAIGYDLIEISYIKSAVPVFHTYVIVGLGASNDLTNVTKARVRHLNGTVPDFSSTSGATVRWISNSFAVGDGAGRYHRYLNAYADTQSVMFDSLFYQVPPSLSTQTADNDALRLGARFSAQGISSADRAIEWGGFSRVVPSGPSFSGSFLRGDGGINVTGADVIVGGSAVGAGAVQGNYLILNTLATAIGITTIGPLVGAGPYLAQFNAALGSWRYVFVAATTQNVAIAINVSNVRKGCQLVFTLDGASLTTGSVTLDWTNGATSLVTNRFAPGDDQPAVALASRTLWTGIAVSTTEVWWTVTRL